MVDLATVTIVPFVIKYLSVSPELIAYAVSNRHCYLTVVLDHIPSIYMVH